MMKRIILCLVLIVALAVAKDCTVSKECNIISPDKDTVEMSICEISDGKGTCTSLTAKSHKDSPSAKEYCGDSFYVEGKCQKYAFTGCSLKDKEAIQCFPGLKYNETCQKPEEKQVTYVDENGACDDQEKLCKFGLACIGKVCRKKLAGGAVCAKDGIPCREGYTCDYGRCVKMYSIDDWQATENEESCKSMTLKNGICYPKTRMQCYSNADCTEGTYCKKEKLEDDKPGVCTNWVDYYIQEYASCIASCSGSEINTEKDCKCETAHIKVACAAACSQRKDFRALKGDFYKYDCKALTRTAFAEENECEIAEQFSNCDAFFAMSSASTVTFGLVSIIALVALLF
jgi:hypothetical protein